MAEFEVPEAPESRKERAIGLIIAAIAVVLAIVSAYGHQTHNEEILAHVDAADQFSFYQAKKDRHAQLALSTDSLTLERERLSLTSQSQVDQLLSTYAAEMKKLDGDAAEIEARGGDLLRESKRLAVKADVLDTGEIALQIAVVLCSISILTEQKLFVRFGVLVAGVGALVALWGLFFMRG
jgi:hypothetical protein